MNSFGVFWFLLFAYVNCQDEYCSEENCHLPSCLCSIENPTSFDIVDLPQFVLLTFVGNITPSTFDSIRTILNTSYRNPNKCPISSTFFIQNIHTNSCLVQRLFDNQNEVGISFSIDKQQHEHLIQHTQIHPSHIKGFRAPDLKMNEDQHFDYLYQHHFHYDSSMVFKSSNLVWPFTLDHPFDEIDCINCQSWTKPYEGLWQFPLHEWTYPNSTRACLTFYDPECLPTQQSNTIDVLFHLLMHNFERHTSQSIGHRSPFIIHLDLDILSQKDNVYLPALIRFIEYSSSHRFVYFVSIEKALEWFKFPRSLDELDEFWAFTCHDKIYTYDMDCSNMKVDSEIAESTIVANDRRNSINHSEERFFSSSIVFHTLWILCLLILAVFFYDKYFVDG